MRAAEAAGDYERLTDWEQRAEQARERRHRRRMDWITAPLRPGPRRRGRWSCRGIGFLLGLGAVLAIAHRDAAWLLTPTTEGRGRHRVGGVAARRDLAAGRWWRCRGWCWPGCGRSGGGTAACRAGPRPTGAREHPTVIVTPGGVAAALAHLGIPAMNRAVKDGWQVEFATPPVRVNGRGYQTTFSLPMGVTPGDDRRQARRAGPQPGPRPVGGVAQRGRARRLRGSVGGRSRARPSGRRPPYPLLHDGTADVFAGVPLGVSQRGDVIAPPLPGRERGVRRGDGAGQVQRRPRHHGRRRAGPAGGAVGVRVRQQRRLRRLPAPAGPLPPRRRRRHRPRRARSAARAV